MIDASETADAHIHFLAGLLEMVRHLLDVVVWRIVFCINDVGIDKHDCEERQVFILQGADFSDHRVQRSARDHRDNVGIASSGIEIIHQCGPRAAALIDNPHLLLDDSLFFQEKRHGADEHIAAATRRAVRDKFEGFIRICRRTGFRYKSYGE